MNNNGVINNQANTSLLNQTVTNQNVVSNGNTNVNLNTNVVSPNVQTTSVIPNNNLISNPGVVNNSNNLDNKKKTKGKGGLISILLLIIVGLGFYAYYISNSYKSQLEEARYNCIPITASKEKTNLDLDSTIVKELYEKVKTTIREDLAQPEFNDNLRLYLAYRQVLETEKYESNCNLFSNLKMEPYTCEVTKTWKPKAFKEEVLVQKIKEMYGEKSNIELSSIKLGSACIGGYQYIPERGEFVEGVCNQQTATSFKATKTLKEATSTRTTIILTEEVKYHENEKMNLPEYLKSGLYYYTFRLDMNYNYVLVSRTYKTKY